MSGSVMQDEHGFYQLDCSKADWSTDKIHDTFHTCGVSLLSDVDFAFTTGKKLFLIEYKNACVNSKAKNSGFNPLIPQMITKIAYKYYGSYFYLILNNISQLDITYVYVVECVHSDKVLRKMLRDKIIVNLPFRLQTVFKNHPCLISDFEVLSIDEWNSKYPDFPLTPCFSTAGANG